MAGVMFQKAVKGKKPLRLVLSGASGSGKSWTSLEFASWLASQTGKRTAAIDTEHGRLSLYADKFQFDVIEIDPPFHPDRLIEIIKAAEENGYGQLIVDSSTHFWNGSGGILELVSEAAKTRFGGNQYAGWSVGTPLQNKVIDTILRSPLHIIFTTRAKQDYLETEKNGKKVYEKVGMGMEQKSGFEFDFDFAIMMDMDNNGMVTKGMGIVPPNTYLKHPSSDAISNIMKAIQENSVDLLSPSESKEYKSKVKSIMDENKDKEEDYKKLFREIGNPNTMNQKEQFETLIEKMKKV